jgi:hypothetical protein
VTLNQTSIAWEVGVPNWLVLMLALATPLLWWRRRVRANRVRAAGCCLACGYDLRGGPAGTSCPECGAPIPAAKPVDAKT